ncbi:TMEM175 family protein [Microbacterium luticocti]|uniref:TMEM175 family protein n=1 Tax=Microbacterium luticocti TaxID=451764 RepID=UPI00041A77A0|nr:TMEM175 family protein [Microbacterium luticocti]
MTDSADDPRLQRVYSSERAKAFIDAVVAIAMTLLILPLMESVGDADPAAGTITWLAEHQWQLISFVLSFAVIASFWVNQHHLFAQVHRVSGGLLWVCIAWLLSIVWMPVATALIGVMPDDDQLVKAVYIGTMICTSILALVQRLVLLRRPELHEVPTVALRRGIAFDIAMAVLFAAALVVAVTVAAVSYYALFLLFLTGPLGRLLARMLKAGPGAHD